MTIFKSTKVIWAVMAGEPGVDDWVESYCADGDGMVQVVVYVDRIELTDQLDVCKTWPADADMVDVMETAQSYLAATWPEIYADAQHNDAEFII